MLAGPTPGSDLPAEANDLTGSGLPSQFVRLVWLVVYQFGLYHVGVVVERVVATDARRS